MPIKCKDVKNLLVEEKDIVGIRNIFGVGVETALACGHNECRTEQGNRMVSLDKDKLTDEVWNFLNEHGLSFKCDGYLPTGFQVVNDFIQALIDAESELIAGKNNVSDDDLCHGQDKFIPDNSTQNTL